MNLRDQIAGAMGFRLVESSDTIAFPHWVDAQGSPVCYDSGAHDGEPGAHPVPEPNSVRFFGWCIERLRDKGWEWGMPGFDGNAAGQVLLAVLAAEGKG